MKKVIAALVVLGLTSFAFAADANSTEGKVEKKAEKKAHKAKKAKKAKEEANATK